MEDYKKAELLSKFLILNKVKGFLNYLTYKEKKTLKKLINWKEPIDYQKLDEILKTMIYFIELQKKGKRRIEHPIIYNIILISAVLFSGYLYIKYGNLEFIRYGGGVIIFSMIFFLFLIGEYGTTFIINKALPNRPLIELQHGIFAGIMLSLILIVRNFIYYDPSISEYRITGIGYTIFFITRVIAAPLLEEYLFRFLLSELLDNFLKLTKEWSYFLNASIFSLAHLPSGIIDFILYLISGIILLFLYKKTKTLFPGIIAHSIGNLTAIVV